MHKIIMILLVSFMLAGCVRKISVEQGNIMTPETLQQIHTGMTTSEVKQILGNPVLLHTLKDHRIQYIYSSKPGGGTFTEKHLTLTFINGILSEISGNIKK